MKIQKLVIIVRDGESRKGRIIKQYQSERGEGLREFLRPERPEKDWWSSSSPNSYLDPIL